MWMHLYLLLEKCFSKASDLELETAIDEITIKQKSYWGVLNFLKKLWKSRISLLSYFMARITQHIEQTWDLLAVDEVSTKKQYTSTKQGSMPDFKQRTWITI